MSNERKNISRRTKVWLISIAILTACGSVKLIQFNRQRNDQLQSIQQEKQILLEEAEKTKTQKEQLEKSLQQKEEEIKKLKQAKARIVPTTYAKASMSEQEALNWIIRKEGGATSVNRSSLACGLAQSLPCSKVLTYAGVDLSKFNLRTYAGVKAAISTVPAETQRAWMLKYILGRYGSCVKAMQFHQIHGWY